MQADDFDFVADLDGAAFDAAGADGAAALDREDVFDGHEEGLVGFAHGLGDVGIEGFDELHDALDGLGVGRVLEGGDGRAADDGDFIAGELVLGEQFADFEFDEVEQFGIVDEVDLVEEDDDARDVDLAGQEHVFAGLGHGAVGGGDDEDAAVHLGGAGDHVLDEVGVAGAVDVGIVARRGFIFDVRDGDGDDLGGVAAALLFGSVGHRVVGHRGGQALGGQHRGDGRGEGGLAMVDVTDGADVHVRLLTFKYALCH